MSPKARYERAWARAVELGIGPQLAELAERAVEELPAAAELYDEIRWGKEPEGVLVLDAPAVYPGQALTELGELELIEYYGRKDGRPFIWTHPFKPEKPHLAVNAERRLVIVGGSYTVTERGIVG